MCKIDLRSILFRQYFPDHFCALPFLCVGKPVKMTVGNLPDDFFVRNQFGDLEGYKGFPEMNGKYVAWFLSVAFKIFCPPFGNMADAFQGFPGCDVCRKPWKASAMFPN